MHRNGIDSAIRAIPQELLQPLYTATVGHCRPYEFRFPGIGLHVGLPERGSSRGRKVRLPPVVRLVETE